MIALAGINRFAWMYTLATTPSTSAGVSMAPANGSKGSYVQLVSGANLVKDCWGIWLRIHSGNTTATARPQRLDIGVDPAGGTSYTVKLADILCGQSGPITQGNGIYYYFPYKVQAGSSIGCRGWSTVTTACRVMGRFYGNPTIPDLVRAGQWSETVGTLSGATGVSLTPGNSGAEGSWVSLGTTTRRCWWWQLSVQPNNGTLTALQYYFDLAWGDASDKTLIQTDVIGWMTSTTEQYCFNNGEDGFADVPAGATLYVRGTCSSTTETGWNAVAVGIGG